MNQMMKMSSQDGVNEDVGQEVASIGKKTDETELDVVYAEVG